MTANEVISIGAAVISIGSLVVAWVKIRPEVRKMSADTAEKFQKIADDAADKITLLQSQLNALEENVSSLKRELYATKEQSVRFENWAKRLAAQLISLGAIPVELDPTRPIRGFTQE